jgi:multidrug efflux pump subunit AcrA (membrane-fusion protein)
VVTGLDDNNHVEILKGLLPGQQVVVSYPIPGEISTSSILPKPPESNPKKR